MAFIKKNVLNLGWFWRVLDVNNFFWFFVCLRLIWIIVNLAFVFGEVLWLYDSWSVKLNVTPQKNDLLNVKAYVYLGGSC